ncbi:hypothetical protein GCM10022224_051070 [Nonomuraea antimicrobica]|uniref:Uncharacterized protein n=1 Tax=Nonomuraea antimicrobica TaxID=561173 RepID=A0ABP7CA68_9ACTN
MGQPLTTATSSLTADACAQRIATQAANYWRAVAAGVPHDPGEVTSLLSEVKALHAELTGEESQ